MKHTVTNGPYGLIRIGDIYFNSNGIFNLEGKKIGTKKAKEIMKLEDFDYVRRLRLEELRRIGNFIRRLEN